MTVKALHIKTSDVVQITSKRKQADENELNKKEDKKTHKAEFIQLEKADKRKIK